MIDANTGIYRLNDRAKFFGFIPNPEQRKEVQFLLDRLWSKSPSFSRTSVNFFRDGDNYHGEILITSGERLFVAKEISNNFNSMLPKLERKISRQLKHWHKSRIVLPQKSAFQSVRA